MEKQIKSGWTRLEQGTEYFDYKSNYRRYDPRTRQDCSRAAASQKYMKMFYLRHSQFEASDAGLCYEAGSIDHGIMGG